MKELLRMQTAAAAEEYFVHYNDYNAKTAYHNSSELVSCSPTDPLNYTSLV
jgi:hypothetical protein